jgi:hypothetical protein
MSVDEEPVDIATVAADAELFEALAAGRPVPADDDMAAMLAAWRADLADDLPTVRTPVMPPPVTGPPASEFPRLAPPRSQARSDVGSRTPLRRRSRARLVAGVAAGVVALAGVTTAAASVAGPDSPLWPVTRVLFPERADSRVAQQEAEQTIERAREAVADSRYSDADKLLDEATAIIGRIEDEDLARTLRAEVEAIRGLLPGLDLPGGGPGGGGGDPGQPQPTRPPTPGGSGEGGGDGGSEPRPTGGGGLPLPTLPPLPTPTLPDLPLPTLPLPTGILP